MTLKQLPDKKHGMFFPDADEQLKAAVRDAIGRKFPAGVPDPVRQRTGTELRLAEENGISSVILVLKQLAETCRKYNAEYIITKTAGNAFLNWLLDITPVNPMAPYVYCPQCGYFERLDTDKYPTAYDDFGGNVCPDCGKTTVRDGFDLPEEFFYCQSQPHSVELRTDKATHPYLYDAMRQLFGSERIGWENLGADASLETILIAPRGMKISDFTDAELIGPGAVVNCHARHWTTRLDSINLPVNDMDELENECPDGFEELLHAVNPSRASDLIGIYGMLHGVGTWTDKTRELLSGGTPLKDIVTTRESVMRYLIRLGVQRQEAYELAEAVRKGFLISRPAEYLPLLGLCEVPKMYLNQLRGVQYLPPEAHAIQELRRQVLLTGYRMDDPQAYRAMVTALEKQDPGEKDESK